MDTSTESLRDSIESALNEATEAPQVVQETPSEAPQEPTETPQEATESDRARDDKGRFAKKAENAQESVEETPPEPEKPARMSPKSWRKEVAEKYWNSLDPELQAEIERREADVNKGFEAYRPKAQFADEMTQALTPYMPTIQALGVNPAEAAARLFNVEHQLRFGNEQQKVQTVYTILSEYGINPESLFNHIQNTPPPDPQVMAMQQYAAQMEQRYNRLLQEQQQKEEYQLISIVEEFSKDKPFIAEVETEMLGLLPLISGNTPQERLQEAYDRAVYANPTTRAAMLQQQNAQAQARQQAQRATSAAVSVKGSSPVSGTAATPKGSLREELESALSNYF